MNGNEPVSDQSTVDPSDRGVRSESGRGERTTDQNGDSSADQPAASTVVCHLRAPLLFEPIDRQVETLQACESAGTVGNLVLRSWPKEVALDDSPPHEEVVETVDRLDRWAENRNLSIRPPFRERTITQLTGESRTLLITPILLIEVYENDRLVGVYPHSDGEETYTAADAIATLRSGALPTPLATLPTRRIGEQATCPDCGRVLLDGQGVFTCVDCSWVGTLTADGEFVTSDACDARGRSRLTLKQV